MLEKAGQVHESPKVMKLIGQIHKSTIYSFSMIEEIKLIFTVIVKQLELGCALRNLRNK